jgi:hypothetical protein
MFQRLPKKPSTIVGGIGCFTIEIGILMAVLSGDKSIVGAFVSFTGVIILIHA